jgi:AGCS family alanine or glycine:cation symporter
MRIFHAICALVVLVGAIIPMDAAWAVADILMGGMTFINLPVCVVLGKVAIKTLDDYVRQRREGKTPVFHGKSIGLDENDLDFWRS